MTENLEMDDVPHMMPMPDDFPPSYEAVVVSDQPTTMHSQPNIEHGADDMHGDTAEPPPEPDLNVPIPSNFDNPNRFFQYKERSPFQWVVSIVCTFFVIAIWGVMLWGVSVAWSSGFDSDHPNVQTEGGLAKWVGVGQITSGFLCIGQICVAGVICFCQIGVCAFSLSMASISLFASLGIVGVGLGIHVGVVNIGTRVFSVIGLGLWRSTSVIGLSIWSYHFGGTSRSNEDSC